MKYWSKIRNVIQVSLVTAVRLNLACAVLLLFGNAGVAKTIVTDKDKTVRIEKAVEALHVDFSSKVQVPAAPEKFTLGFYLLPDQFHFTLESFPLFSCFSQFLGTVATNTFYVFTCINAP
ncbi:MAG: hypothetical protein V4714_03275 [Bacteroidota bacterium]